MPATCYIQDEIAQEIGYSRQAAGNFLDSFATKLEVPVSGEIAEIHEAAGESGGSQHFGTLDRCKMAPLDVRTYYEGDK